MSVGIMGFSLPSVDRLYGTAVDSGRRSLHYSPRYRPHSTPATEGLSWRKQSVHSCFLSPHCSVALHLTVVKLTCNENGVQTYSSWYASTHSQEDSHGPHNDMLLQ